MTKPMIQVGNEVRQMTDNEYAQFLIDQETARLNAEQSANLESLRQAAKSKLESLGLTDDELKALGVFQSVIGANGQ